MRPVDLCIGCLLHKIKVDIKCYWIKPATLATSCRVPLIGALILTPALKFVFYWVAQNGVQMWSSDGRERDESFVWFAAVPAALAGAPSWGVTGFFSVFLSSSRSILKILNRAGWACLSSPLWQDPIGTHLPAVCKRPYEPPKIIKSTNLDLRTTSPPPMSK